MKYCVSGRQPISVLKSADEIRIEYKDKEILYKYMEELQDKTYILEIPKDLEFIDWNEIKMFSEKIDLIVSFEDIRMCVECKKLNIKFMWLYEIVSFYELCGMLALGVSRVKLGAPLYFDLPQVKKSNVQIMLTANLCFNSYIPRPNGVCGTYVRPEDIPAYEKYVESIDFDTKSLEQEETLLKIYKDDKQWPGNLNLILTNFGVNVDNRAIPEQFGEARTQCRQVCQRGGHCRLCYTSIDFSKTLDKAKEDWI